ncbi:MAG: DNA double-strand break repair nuclease NurA [Desulfobaccales bacterium]
MEAFADLPDALVRDLLAKAVPVAERVSQNLQALRDAHTLLSTEARKHRLICRKADLDVPREPSVVGVDGSYQVHRLTALDLCAAAAVAVEGTSKEAVRYWPEPYHDMWVDGLPHRIDTVGVLRGMMVSMEMSLAAQAPHDLVLLDGSFSSLIIYLNQALTKIEDCGKTLADDFLGRWQGGMLDQLKGLLTSNRTVAMPKFTSRNEFLRGNMLNPPVTVDGKTLATIILSPGEYTRPLALHDAADPGSQQVDHLPEKYCPKKDMDEIMSALNGLSVIYFRPYGWLPALRMGIPSSIACSNAWLSIVLEGVTRQFFSPAVIEPYPLFLADRMVKSLGSGVAVIEQTVSQHVAESSPDIENTLLFLQNYRTEGGRGGV